MSEEKGSTWFPNTNFSGPDKDSGREWFPKSEFPEMIEISEPKVKGESQCRFRSMPQSELPGFVAGRLEDAFVSSWSGARRTLAWYIGAMDGGDLVDRKTLRRMEGFQKEAEEAEDHPSRKAFVEKVAKYLRGMQVKGR